MTKPLASIIIPNYNGAGLLTENLPKIIHACPDCEFIIVDDASTDNSVQLIKEQFKAIILIELTQNQRFAGACNAGVKQATADIVILLNNDVVPNSDFINSLLDPFKNSQVFAVGCAETNSEGKISGRSGSSFNRGLAIHWRCLNQIKTTTMWVSGGSGAFRKSIWNELGGMDILFKPAYEEDRDLCYRAMKRGYQLCFSPQSQVFHHHETTNKSVLGHVLMERASFKNHLIFVWKNITDPQLFMQHLLWLPYHLVFTTIKTQGNFFIGFLWAIQSLPSIIAKRIIEAKQGVVNDQAIFSSFKD